MHRIVTVHNSKEMAVDVVVVVIVVVVVVVVVAVEVVVVVVSGIARSSACYETMYRGKRRDDEMRCAVNTQYIQ